MVQNKKISPQFRIMVSSADKIKSFSYAKVPHYMNIQLLAKIASRVLTQYRRTNERKDIASFHLQDRFACNHC